MDYWEYTLSPASPVTAKKGAWDWQYGDHKGVKLASNHVSSDHKATINMGDVRILDAVQDAFFADASQSLAGLK